MKLLVPVVNATMERDQLDMQAVVRCCRSLPSLRALNPIPEPLLKVRVYAEGRPNISGRARYRTNLIRIGYWPTCERERVVEMLLHEVVHLVVGKAHGKRMHHGPEFRVALLMAAFELWPHIRGHVRNEGRCYGMDHRIWHAARLTPRELGQRVASVA